MRKLRMLIIAGLIAILPGVYAMADDYDIKVRLNQIGSEESILADFGDYAPIQKDYRTFVHIRGFGDQTGMKIGWDQENKTAFIKLIAGDDTPAARYAKKQFEALADRALGYPSNITVSMMVDNCEAVLRYNYDVGDGNVRGYVKVVEMDAAAMLVDDGALMVPIRHLMELLGFNILWDEETKTVDVTIPQTVTIPDSLTESDQWIPTAYYAADTPPGYIPDGVHELGEYLGNFKLTKYCTCNVCNGGWGPYTAWAGRIIPGQTIGVNLDDIPKLAWVYIDTVGWRRAEDTGGGIGSKHIDIAVATHTEALSGNIRYRDVWLAK